MVDSHESCDLCGLKIAGNPVVERFDGEEKRFCCRGCARVYQVAAENGMLDQVLPQPAAKRYSLKEVVLNPGETAHFSINGMWCAGCADAAERILKKQPGVKEANVNFAAELGRIQFDPELVDTSTVLKSLEGLGYQARLLTDKRAQEDERQEERLLLQLIAALAFGMQVMLLYIEQLYPHYAAGEFNLPAVRNIQYLVWLLATPALFFGGISFLRGAWRAIRAGTATMDTLVALGTLSAYIYSLYITIAGNGEVYFDSVVMITTFIMLGRYLEKIGGARARKDIRKLMKLQPETAWKHVQDQWQRVNAGELSPGDQILVKPGERVPADSLVLDGHAAVDESLLSGEAIPVDKSPGDSIYAGTVITDEALLARVTRKVGDTRLAQIAQIVTQTLNTKPPIQRMADRASTYFALSILAIAVLTFLGWSLSGKPFSAALLTAISVLVVACPCALGLATPLAIATTLGQTSKAGIIVRNPAAIETAGFIQRVVFDKTGTLTRGNITLVDVFVDPSTGISSENLLCQAAAVEQFSEHPVARAIVTACPTLKIHGAKFKLLRGLGVSAQLPAESGKRIMVGSAKFLGLNGGKGTALEIQADRYTGQGDMVVWVGTESVVSGFLVLRDEVNPTALPALRQLEAAHIMPAMLSGDSERTTRAVATELGIQAYQGNISPAEKAEKIRNWQASNEKVAMIGDGVNDAPALAQADLSITVSGGSDIAGETSDLLLARPDLTLIPWFIQLSERTRQIIRENLGWAFAYNLVAVPLAAAGIISPIFAALAMATSSLLVVGNSLRLRHSIEIKL